MLLPNTSRKLHQEPATCSPVYDSDCKPRLWEPKDSPPKDFLTFSSQSALFSYLHQPLTNPTMTSTLLHIKTLTFRPTDLDLSPLIFASVLPQSPPQPSSSPSTPLRIWSLYADELDSICFCLAQFPNLREVKVLRPAQARSLLFRDFYAKLDDRLSKGGCLGRKCGVIVEEVDEDEDEAEDEDLSMDGLYLGEVYEEPTAIAAGEDGDEVAKTPKRADSMDPTRWFDIDGDGNAAAGSSGHGSPLTTSKRGMSLSSFSSLSSSRSDPPPPTPAAGLGGFDFDIDVRMGGIWEEGLL